jgi:oligopeptide/dipeptide ABC transporter ATP-binding protein
VALRHLLSRAAEDAAAPSTATRAEAGGKPLLDVRDLRTHFLTRAGVVRAVDGVSFALSPGETVGLVGESGSGKSVTALSLLRLLPKGGIRMSGSADFVGVDLLSSGERTIRRIRGRRIAMVFQDPTTALNPMLSIGLQMTEGIRVHLGVDAREAAERSVDLLRQVGISAPDRRMAAYPHELSGGMRQRVMIAIALGCEPALLLADEPSTALDVTIQAQILELLAGLAAERGIAMVLITHNMGVVASYTSRTLVMYAGKVVEEAPTATLFRNPRHPYTIGLLESIPRLRGQRAGRLASIEGTPPDPLSLPAGCSFAPRCRFAVDASRESGPPLEAVGPGHRVACWVKPGA